VARVEHDVLAGHRECGSNRLPHLFAQGLRNAGQIVTKNHGLRALLLKRERLHEQRVEHGRVGLAAHPIEHGGFRRDVGPGRTRANRRSGIGGRGEMNQDDEEGEQREWKPHNRRAHRMEWKRKQEKKKPGGGESARLRFSLVRARS
jgi:hypothetical protein